MFTAEFVIAAVLLTSPKEQAVPKSHEGWLHALKPTLMAFAIDGEVLDPREKGFVLGHDVAGDLAMLRGRYQELAPAPMAGEGQRFPDRKFINEVLALNRAYRNQLSARLAIDLVYSEELRKAIAETDQIYQIWDTVRDARCEYYYVTVRRQALQLLRNLIGAEAFYTGQMPPHIPVWHLPRD
jgi:hypothetical protein